MACLNLFEFGWISLAFPFLTVLFQRNKVPKKHSLLKLLTKLVNYWLDDWWMDCRVDAWMHELMWASLSVKKWAVNLLALKYSSLAPLKTHQVSLEPPRWAAFLMQVEWSIKILMWVPPLQPWWLSLASSQLHSVLVWLTLLYLWLVKFHFKD